MNNQKILFLVIVVVIIIIITGFFAVGFNKYLPTTKKSNLMKTYKNEQAGIEFSYPENFGLTEDPNNTPDNIQIYVSPTDNPQADNWRIEVQKASFSFYSGSCSEIATPSPSKKITDIVIDGLNGKKIESLYQSKTDSSVTFFTTVCIDKGDLTLQFIRTSYSEKEITDKYDYTLFNKMVSSVKFSR